MALTNGIVIKVVCWGYFDNARTKFKINIIIGDDGYGAITQR